MYALNNNITNELFLDGGRFELCVLRRDLGEVHRQVLGSLSKSSLNVAHICKITLTYRVNTFNKILYARMFDGKHLSESAIKRFNRVIGPLNNQIGQNVMLDNFSINGAMPITHEQVVQLMNNMQTSLFTTRLKEHGTFVVKTTL